VCVLLPKVAGAGPGSAASQAADLRHANEASGGVALFGGIPAALAAAGAALMDPRWVEDLGELLRFTACWPSDDK
jgi:hypothetical protein